MGRSRKGGRSGKRSKGGRRRKPREGWWSGQREGERSAEREGKWREGQWRGWRRREGQGREGKGRGVEGRWPLRCRQVAGDDRLHPQRATAVRWRQRGGFVGRVGLYFILILFCRFAPFEATLMKC